MSALIVLSISSPYFSEWDFEQMDFNAMETAPSLTHWFGTDQVGRDLYIRTMSGIKVSLFVSLLATLVSIPIGVTWGSVAGYIGGRVDELMMRFVDVLYSLPFILIVILLTVIFGPENHSQKNNDQNKGKTVKNINKPHHQLVHSSSNITGH